jgi:enoyl-CoA hydratase/carnithine racemase
MSEAKHLVLLEDCGNYAVVTFNRPEKRNALSSPMVSRFQEILQECRGRHSVIVVTGVGDVFCAGVDLKERNAWVRSGAKIRGDSVRNKWYDTIGTIVRNHPAIFIAAVNGLCLGAGMTLINICELAIMAEEAELGIPQVTFGIYPGVAGASMQTRVLRKHAAMPILTGKRFGAERAVDMGFVNMAVPRARLMNEARALAAHIAKFDPVALDWCKKALDEIPSQISSWPVALEYGRSVSNMIRDQIGKDNVVPSGF